MSHRAAVNHAALERSTAVRAACEAIVLTSDIDGDEGGAAAADAQPRRAFTARAETRNRLLLRCLVEFTRASASALQLAESAAFGSRLLRLLAEAPLDSALLPMMIEILLNVVQADAHEGASMNIVSALDPLLRELLRDGSSARDAALRNDVLGCLVALAQARSPPLRRELAREGGVLAALSECLASPELGLASAYERPFNLQGPGALELARAALALVHALHDEIGALPAGCSLLDHLGTALVALARPVAASGVGHGQARQGSALASNSNLTEGSRMSGSHAVGNAWDHGRAGRAPQGLPGSTAGAGVGASGFGGGNSLVSASALHRQSVQHAQRHQLRISALRALSLCMRACGEAFARAGGDTMLLAALRCDEEGQPAREAAEIAHGALSALSEAMRFAPTAAVLDYESVVGDILAALELAVFSPPAPAASESLLLSPAPAPVRLESLSVFGERAGLGGGLSTLRPAFIGASRVGSAQPSSGQAGSHQQGLGLGSVARDRHGARESASMSFGSFGSEDEGDGADGRAYALASVRSQAALLDCLTMACALEPASAPKLLAERNGVALLVALLREATRLGSSALAHSDWLGSLVECVSAAVLPLPEAARALVAAGGLAALLQLVARSQRALRAQQLCCAAVIIEAAGEPAAQELLRWYASPGLVALRPSAHAHLARGAPARLGDGGSEPCLSMLARLWRAEEELLGLVRLHGGVVAELADPLAGVPLSEAAEEVARELQRAAAARGMTGEAAAASAGLAGLEGGGEGATEAPLAPAHVGAGQEADGASGTSKVALAADGAGPPSAAAGLPGESEDASEAASGDADGDGFGASYYAERSVAGLRADGSLADDDEEWGEEGEEQEEEGGWPPRAMASSRLGEAASPRSVASSSRRSNGARNPTRPASRRGTRGFAIRENGGEQDVPDSDAGLDGAPAADGELSAIGVRVALGTSLSALSLGAESQPPAGEAVRTALEASGLSADLRMQLAALVAAAHRAAPAAYAEAVSALNKQVRAGD